MEAPGNSQRLSQTQTGAQRRELRREYRLLQAQARQNKDALASTTAAVKFTELLSKADRLHDTIEKPKEAVVDAELFCQLAEAGYDASRQLAKNKQKGRTVEDFLFALCNLHVPGTNPQEDAREKPGVFDWHTLGHHASSLFKTAPGVSCMLGAMEVQVKVRKVAQRQQRQRPTAVQRPEEVPAQQAENNDKQETDRNMEEMYSVMETIERCPVAELVCNHKSFAQTVENLFTLAFLVRDQRAHLSYDAEMGLMAQVVNKQHPAPPRSNGRTTAEQSQFVITFDMGVWEDMKRVVATSDCKMKHRDAQDKLEQVLHARKKVKLDLGAASPAAARAAAGGAAGPSSSQAPPASAAGPSSRRRHQ